MSNPPDTHFPRVRVMPASLEFEVLPGESIRTAALRNGLRWPSTCGGQAECMLCYVEVLEGEACFNEVSAKEAAALRRVAMAMPRLAGACRLACQSVVSGDVVVQKKGVRPAVQ